jgi:hypothetical protein
MHTALSKPRFNRISTNIAAEELGTLTYLFKGIGSCSQNCFKSEQDTFKTKLCRQIANVSMRLINCTTFKLEEFFGDDIPDYTILSHTWGEDEVTFASFNNDFAYARRQQGFQKIKFACNQTLRDGYNYTWVDTCAIDKTSSAELTEAINSMFRWYQASQVCYVYLCDVAEGDGNAFENSRWFSRGWTLQELLAPQDVQFFNRNKDPLGSKLDLCDKISSATNIRSGALYYHEHKPHEDLSEATLEQYCIAERMSWAANRQTTRVEDRAYSLLGIFNVNMPLLYGEGEKAFLRLQEEIIRTHDDDSILAWGLDTTKRHSQGELLKDVGKSVCGGYTLTNILACSPDDFRNCSELQYDGKHDTPFSITNTGLQIHMPVIPTTALGCCTPTAGELHGSIGLLQCSPGSDGFLLGILLSRQDLEQGYMRTERVQNAHATFLICPRAVALAVPAQLYIQEQREIKSIRDYKFGQGKIIITESSALLRLGYRLDIVKGLYLRHGNWNHETAVYSLGSRYERDYLIGFRYRQSSRSQYGDFTVFVGEKGVLVKCGLTFTEQEERGYAMSLGYDSEQRNKDIISLGDCTERVNMVASMDQKLICNWQIQNVFITVSRADYR